jgi:hypothetical protein
MQWGDSRGSRATEITEDTEIEEKDDLTEQILGAAIEVYRKLMKSCHGRGSWFMPVLFAFGHKGHRAPDPFELARW